MAWHTVTDALILWGSPLVEDPDRLGATRAIGVDETSFLAATASEGPAGSRASATSKGAASST